MSLRCQHRPCVECPWRTDVETGRFRPERYRNLARSAYDMGNILFACHKSPEGGEVVCAGFLARGADHNMTIRLAYITREIEFDPNRGGDFPLYENFRQMAEANGVDPADPVLSPCR